MHVMKNISKPAIAFFLPKRDLEPCGGYKVVYEYANRFAADGYQVSIIYPHIPLRNSSFKYNFPIYKLLRMIKFFYQKSRRRFHAAEWFPLVKNIKKDFVYTFTYFFLRHYKQNTIFIATAINTSFALAKVKQIPDAHKYYLIQDFEAWNGSTDETVYDSYRLPLTKIVIAPWLKERVESTGQQANLIFNGFDFTYFTLTNPIETRKGTEIALLYHLDDRKRCCDSFAALNIVKRSVPDLHVTMFGTPPRPDTLPDWYTYYQTPDKEQHNDIYNNAAIFIAASKAEGMALPPAEAMICGCALCCTDIGGFSVYAKHNQTALLSPVYDVQALAQNILTLIHNPELRIRLATAGNQFIRQFTWEKAYAKFKQVVFKTSDNRQ